LSRGAASSAALAAAVLAGAACGRGRRAEPYVTYFAPEQAVTVRLPADWTTDQVEQEGTLYRYFLAPGLGPQRKPAVSVALLVAPLAGGLDQHAQTYLGANKVESTREARGSGLTGKSWRFSSPDGATRYSLLLLPEQNRVYGLYGQGEAARFEEHADAVEEMEKSLTLERPARYPEHRNDTMAFSLRVPESWRTNRNFSGGGTYLMQFTSPALGVEGRETVHASLNLTVEPAPGTLDAYHKAVRDRLGEPFRLLNHALWRDGYVDIMRSETPMAISQVKRFYRVRDGRGYTLAFEARDDIYHRVARWADLIAATLKVGSEAAPQVRQP
jgi:hypothetical protein